MRSEMTKPNFNDNQKDCNVNVHSRDDDETLTPNHFLLSFFQWIASKNWARYFFSPLMMRNARHNSIPALQQIIILKAKCVFFFWLNLHLQCNLYSCNLKYGKHRRQFRLLSFAHLVSSTDDCWQVDGKNKMFVSIVLRDMNGLIFFFSSKISWFWIRVRFLLAFFFGMKNISSWIHDCKCAIFDGHFSGRSFLP